MDDRDLARMMGLTRVAFGAAFLLAPRRFARLWTGETTDTATATIASRATGGRDIALGLGLLMALEDGAPARRWLEAGAVADATDCVSCAASWQKLGAFRALASIATAAGAAWLGVRLASTIDD